MAAISMPLKKESFATNIDCAEKGTCISEQTDQPKLLEISTETKLSDISIDSTLTRSSAKTEILMDKKELGKDQPHNLSFDIIPRNFETYPQGFPRLAAFQNSSSDLALFRRFGTAHCRILMHMQCEITGIVKRLDELDISDSEEEGGMLYRLRRNEWYEGLDRTQKDLLAKLQDKLLIYDDLLLKDRELRALASPQPQHYQSLYNWILGCKPLDGGQYDFLFDRDDFVASTANKKSNRFDEIIERGLNRWPGSKIFQKLLGKEPVHGGKSSDGVYTFSRTKAAVVAKLLAVSVAGAILLIPVFLLYLKEMSHGVTAGMVVIFVLTFGILMSLFTGARVEGVFVGTCTYCAVLMAFLGNVQVRNGAGGH